MADRIDHGDGDDDDDDDDGHKVIQCRLEARLARALYHDDQYPSCMR